MNALLLNVSSKYLEIDLITILAQYARMISDKIDFAILPTPKGLNIVRAIAEMLLLHYINWLL